MMGSMPLACKPRDTLRMQLGVIVETLSVKGMRLSRVNLTIKLFEALILDTIISLILSPTLILKTPFPRRGSLNSVILRLTLALAEVLELYTAI